MLNAVKTQGIPARAEPELQIKNIYLETLSMVERLHRRLLDVIKDEFDRRDRSDVNAVQALLLYNIGDKELTAGELRTCGYYLGSNVSYNVKKLVEMGFLHHARSRASSASGLTRSSIASNRSACRWERDASPRPFLHLAARHRDRAPVPASR